MRKRRWLGAALVAAASVGLASMPAVAATGSGVTTNDPLDCLLEATGTVSVTPWPEVALGAPVEVDWSTSAPCAFSVQISGPGFGATERLAKTGSRQVTPLSVTGLQRWTLTVSVARAGSSDVDFDQVHVRGPVTSAMASAVQLGGVVHVFEATASGGLRMRRQRTPGVDDWTGPSPLDVPAGKLLQNVAAASNLDGRIELFAVDRDGVIYHRYQTSQVSETWSGWEASFGTDVVGMALTRMADGRLVIFASTADGQLWVRWENDKNTSSAWGSWVVLGNDGVNLRGLAAGTDKDGHLELWALDAAGNIYQKWQASPQSDPSAAWGGFGVVPGGLNTIAITSNVDGRLEVFGTNTSAGVYHNAQLAANGTTGWTGWQQFDGGLFSMTVTPNWYGTIELAGLGGGGFYWSRAQHTTSVGGWTGWLPMPDNPDNHPAYDPVNCTPHLIMCQYIDVNNDGLLDAVAVVDDDPSNNGWQGRALVARGSVDANHDFIYLPPAVWAITGCQTPGEDCQFAEMNGDGQLDLVEFTKSSVTGGSTNAVTGANEGDVLVYTAWPRDANADRFAPAEKASDWACTGSATCVLGDVNGDRQTDVVAFTKSTTGVGSATEGNVWVSRGSAGFLFPQEQWSNRICVQAETCRLGDVNGDGKADAVAFVGSSRSGADAGDVWVALSTGTGFAAATKWADSVCVGNQVCGLADTDGDGRYDAIAKDPNDTSLTVDQAWVAPSLTTNAFGSALVQNVAPQNLAAATPGGVHTNAGGVDCGQEKEKYERYLAMLNFYAVLYRLTRIPAYLAKAQFYASLARSSAQRLRDGGCPPVLELPPMAA